MLPSDVPGMDFMTLTTSERKVSVRLLHDIIITI